MQNMFGWERQTVQKLTFSLHVDPLDQGLVSVGESFK